MTEEVSGDVVARVLQALGDSKFRWRTLNGVARDSDQSIETVHQVIAQVADQVVRSSVPSKDGQDLYTTRENFRASASIPERLLGALKNRAG
jgi:hypothetical protein